jgi:hypothetical protein
MMRAVAFAALLVLLAPPSPALAQFRPLIDPLLELFQPKPEPKPKPRHRPAEPVPLPPMNPLHQPAEPAPPPETREEAAGEPPVPLPPIKAPQQSEAPTMPPETREDAAAKPPVPLPPMKPPQEGEAPAMPPSRTDDGAAATGEPPKGEPVEDQWSEAEVMEALGACIARLGPILAEVEALSPIKAKRCGTAAPVRLKRLGADPGVEISPAATLNCDMVLALNTWIRTAVQPAAERLLGSRIVRLRNVSSYSCRNRNSAAEGPISEHAFANALDIAGFTTADGRQLAPLKHWGATRREIEAARRAAEAARQAAEAARQAAEAEREAQAKASPEGAEAARAAGNEPPLPEPVPIPSLRPEAPPAGSDAPPTEIRAPETEFLRAVHKAACGDFRTVLGPEANNAHRDHFHLDLAPRRRGAYCE